MEVTFSSLAGKAAGANEDWVGATATSIVVLDGVSSPEDLGSGCIHGVQWYVRNLGARFLANTAIQPSRPLRDSLAEAIQHVADSHRDTCVLSHVGTPSATVVAFQEDGDSYSYLVLSDSTLVLKIGDAEIKVVTDNTASHLLPDHVAAVHAAAGTPQHAKILNQLISAQRRLRNVPEGYWVAASNPEAAEHAIIGGGPKKSLKFAALLTDGASALVDIYARRSWSEFLIEVERVGPKAVIAEIRRIEASDPDGHKWPRYKMSDDATIAVMKQSI